MQHSTSESPSQSEPGLKERFYRQFQQEAAALQKQIDRISTASLSAGDRASAVDACLAGIDSLSHLAKDASSYLPAYDRRAYADSVKSLSEKLQKVRSEAAPAKKFQFRSARKAAQQASPGASQQTEQPQRPMERRSNATSTMSTPPGSATIPGAPAASGKQTLGISNQVSAHVKLNPADCSAPGSGTITNINRSVIDISGPTETNGPYASLVLKDIQNSLIVTGHVDGPVHMTGLKNTVLVTACRQFRMHASSKVDVYLHCSSRPIIEDCERIRFAPIPETFVTPAIRGTSNQWDQIDDFKWLKLEPSPHFSVLGEPERIKDDIWHSFTSKESAQPLTTDGALKAVGITLEDNLE